MTTPLSRYLSLFRRWAWLLVLGTVLASLASYLVSRSLPPVYRVTTKLLVTQGGSLGGGDTYNNLLGAERLARTYANLLRTRPVIEQAVQTLGLPLDPQEVEGLLEIRLIPDTEILQVSIEHTNPQLARDILDALTTTFISQNDALQASRFQASRTSLASQVAQFAQELDQRTRALAAVEAQLAPPGPVSEALQTEIAGLRRQVFEGQQAYANVLRSFEEVRLAEARSLNSVAVVEPALLPRAPVGPRVLVNTALAAVVGLLMTAAFVLIREILDDAVPTPERLSAETGLATLAVVDELPRGMTLPLLAAGRNGSQDGEPLYSATAEAYRMLQTNIQFSGLAGRSRILLVASATAGEGKTTTAANLALALAQSGFRTVLVDTNLRHPSLHELFDLRNEHGLSTILIHGGTAQEYAQTTSEPTLHVITAGPVMSNPQLLLGSLRMVTFLEHIRQTVDYVILDGPPVLAFADALTLAPHADGVLLVVNARRASSASVRRARQAFERVGARIIGAVLNRTRPGTGGDSSVIPFPRPMSPRTQVALPSPAGASLAGQTVSADRMGQR